MFTSHKSLTTSFTFKKCFFNTLSDALEKEGGGASFFNNEDGKLKVEKSQFHSCESSSHGGAIYVSSSLSCKLVSSIFCSCKAVTNGMGGAVYIHSTDDALVQNSIFLLCKSVQFGSGLEIRDSNTKAKDYFAVQSSSFIACHSVTHEADGGGMEIYSNTVTLGIISCLLSQCTAVDGGGGIYFDCSSSEHADFPIVYCFFNYNEAVRGNDVCLYGAGSTSPFFLCFSTSSSPRISGGSDDWLPLIIVSLSLGEPLTKLYTHTSHAHLHYA